MAALNKVRAGDPVVNSATAYNAFVDAARDFQARQHNRGSTPQRQQRQTGIILVRNDTGTLLDRFAVLGLAGPLIDPTENLEEFQNLVAMSGVVPAANHRSRFAILLDPAGAGDIVRACVSGACVVQVRMDHEDHRQADVDPNDTRWLLSADAGLAQLLWVQPVEDRIDPSVALTVARLGGGGGSAVIASWLGMIVNHVAGALYEVWEVEDSSPTPGSPLELAIKSGGKHVAATNLVELGAGPGGAGFGGITAAPEGITPPPRYVVVHEINAGAGVRYIFESYPGQILNMYAFIVTGLDDNGCACGFWVELTGPSIMSTTPVLPACPEPPEEG